MKTAVKQIEDMLGMEPLESLIGRKFKHAGDFLILRYSCEGSPILEVQDITWDRANAHVLILYAHNVARSILDRQCHTDPSTKELIFRLAALSNVPL